MSPRKPGQLDLKPCAIKGCPTRIQRSEAFCLTHWELLPTKIQAGIDEAWREKAFHALPRLVAEGARALCGGGP